MNVVSLCRFTDVAQPDALAADIRRLCDGPSLPGTLPVAPEGPGITAVADTRRPLQNHSKYFLE